MKKSIYRDRNGRGIAVRKFFRMMKLAFILILITTVQLNAQEKVSVSGRVIDATGYPIPGANVYNKSNPQNGGITDIDGYYSISVDSKDVVLIFSFIGFVDEEVKVSGQSEINITLVEDSIGLDEVVAVGYGTQKKSDITGSVVTFDTNVLKERPQTNLAQALQGNMAGVTVTTSSSSAEDEGIIVIRGKNSISAANDPLVILDGIPYDGGFASINPNDVADIQILKDASSTAIYGSRGSNGVILITTKKGKGKMKVSYSGHYSIDEIAHMPDMQNASQYWASRWERKITNPLSDPTSTSDLESLVDQNFNEDSETVKAFMEGYPGQTWDEVSSAILANYDGEVHDRETLLQLAQAFAYPNGGRDTDWVKEATRLGHKEQHNISVSGSTDKLTYYLSAAYDKSEGIAKGDDFERMVYRINLGLNLTDWLTYGTNMQLGIYDRSGEAADWSGGAGAFELASVYNAYNADGSLDLSPDDNDTGMENPMEPLLFDNEDKETRIVSNHFIDIDVPGVKGLHYKLNTGYQWSYRNDRTYKGLNTVEGSIVGGDLEVSNKKDYAWTVENILSYTRSFGKHNLFLTALFSAQESVSDQNGIEAQGFTSDVMSFYQASTANIKVGTESYTKKNYISQMLRANYGFDNRYMLTATVRRDGYSAFGADTKFGVFPSVALGWNIANESFMESIDIVDILKLRASYGVNGNEAISPYSTLPQLSGYNYINEDGSPAYGFFPEQLSNPILSWETTKAYNIGLDYTLLGGRIRGTIDAYKSKTTDLLLDETISSINGTTSILRNIGETNGQGIEFQISAVNIDNGVFSWRTNLNATVYDSEIVNVGLTDEDGNYIDDIASEWFIGEGVDVNYDYVMNRVLQKDDFITDGAGNYVLDENNAYQLTEESASNIVLNGSPKPGLVAVEDTNGDGIITSADMQVIGDMTPDLVAGISNTFKYKNWTFSFFLNSVWGMTKENDMINNNKLGPSRKMNIDFWTPENPLTSLPGINENSSEPNMSPYVDVNFVRIQDVSLSYKFPKVKGFSNLEVYANVKNLHTFTNWEGLDPEYASGSGNSSSIPRVRSYVFGVRMSF